MPAQTYCDFLASLQGHVRVVGTQDAAKQLAPAALKKMTRIVAAKTYDEAPAEYLSTVIPCQWLLQSLLGASDPKYTLQKRLLKSVPGIAELNLDGKNWGHDQSVVFRYVLSPYAALILGIRDGNKTTIIVMFRGARQGEDVRRAVNWRRARLQKIDTRRDVHHGVSNTYGKAWPVVRAELETMYRAAGQGSQSSRVQTIVCGLSFGACLATLAANELGQTMSRQLSLFTFGGQRAGTASFYERMLRPERRLRNFLRVYNGDDYLVHIPPRLLGFYHVDEYLSKVSHSVPSHHGVNLQKLLPIAVQQMVNKSGSMTNRSTLWHTAYGFCTPKGVVLLQAPCSARDMGHSQRR